MADIAFVDIETGGLNPDVHPLVEVAIIQWPEEELIHFSVPFELSDCTPQAIKIAGLDRRPELDSICEHVFDAVGILRDSLKGRVFIANNPTFDAAFIKTFLARGGYTPEWHYHLVDIKALVAGKFGCAPPWTSGKIAQLAGVPLPSAAHTAVADCEWNRDVYVALNLQEGAEQ